MPCGEKIIYAIKWAWALLAEKLGSQVEYVEMRYSILRPFVLFYYFYFFSEIYPYEVFIAIVF